MTSTDFLRLSEHALFKNLRDTLPKNIKKTQSIVCIKDDTLYTWDFQDNCILTLNVKATRNEEVDNVIHQSLLPQTPPLFTPHSLIVNDANTLVAVVGTKGLLVVELPDRCPPYGAFGNNKEVIYCRSLSLHERILAFGDHLEVRQAKFHPGSPQNTHILMLTSDNLLRLYKIENGSETPVGIYPVGVQPMARFPETKTPFLEALGETAVDFDFAPPEHATEHTLNIDRASSPNANDTLIADTTRDLSISCNISMDALSSTKIHHKLVTHQDENKNTCKPEGYNDSVIWPILVLYGNGDVFTVSLELKPKAIATVKGPLPMLPDADENYGKGFCSILCLHSTPPIVCIANCKGTIHHTLLLPIEEDFEFMLEENRPNFVQDADKSLYIFEYVELELGLATSNVDYEYSCPIVLHKNLAKLGHYFATHETGVHSVSISCVDDLQKFVSNQNEDAPDPDLFNQPSVAEYMICTKVASSETANPVIGFAVSYEHPSILVLLANGQLVTLSLATLFTMNAPDILEPEEWEVLNSPLKKMLSEPFDVVIQKILKQSTTQPILKLPSAGVEHTQQECYELLQRATKVFRDEHFKNHTRAREEIEKRIKTLTKLKEIQKKDVEKLMSEKQKMQQTAESLAEKYEDIKDKQEEMAKRCEKLLILIAKRKAEPSNAEIEFMKDLKDGETKIETYQKAIAKIKNMIKYQELQMEKWHSQNEKQNVLGNVQVDAIKSNLQDMTQKIAKLVNEVNQYKKQLNLK